MSVHNVTRFFSGINAVIFYTKTIFKDSGTNVDEHISTIIIGVLQVVATLGGYFLALKAKRKVLLIISSSVMCISLISLGIFFHLKENEMSENVKWLPLGSLMVYICAFSIGYGPLPWTVMLCVLHYFICKSNQCFNNQLVICRCWPNYCRQKSDVIAQVI